MTEQQVNYRQLTLNGDHSAGAGTITVAGTVSDLPTSGTYRGRVDNEIVEITARAGNVFTVNRGQEGTTAAFHANNSSFYLIETAAGLTQVAADIQAATLAAAAALYQAKRTRVNVTHSSGATVLSANQLAMVDVSGGAPPSITMAAPSDLDRVGVVNSAGDASATHIVVTANAGWTIEDPNAAPGTFSATATIAIKSAAFEWMADTPNTRWKLV